MSESRAVFDASVFVRAIADGRADAREWIGRVARDEVRASVPGLVYYEVADALARYVRAGSISLAGAVTRLQLALDVPVEVRDDPGISIAALGTAVGRGLSVYDAAYAVLAEAEDAVLVTADRDLAAATERAELLA